MNNNIRINKTGIGSWVGDPGTEFAIGEVAHWTGYSKTTLARLDQERKVVAAHRLGRIRYWYARDIQRIIDYREKMIKVLERHSQTLYRYAQRAAKVGS